MYALDARYIYAEGMSPDYGKIHLQQIRKQFDCWRSSLVLRIILRYIWKRDSFSWTFHM